MALNETLKLSDYTMESLIIYMEWRARCKRQQH